MNLRSLVSLALVTLVWATNNLHAKAPPTSPLPLQAGNQWVLVGTNFESRTIACTSSENNFWLVTGLFDEPLVLRARGNGNSIIQASLNGRSSWQTIIRPAKTANDSWRFNGIASPCGKARAFWADTSPDQSTPAGLFVNCQHWQVRSTTVPNNACQVPSVTDVWFAPDIGPVALQTGDGELFKLTSAVVGNTTYPVVASQVPASLTADAATYTNVTDHVFYCPPCNTNNPPCEAPCYLTGGSTAIAHFTFQVTNSTPDTQTFTFPTTKQYDLQLIDTNGVVVIDWGDGQPYAQVITTITLAPGESQPFEASVPLVDKNHNRLSGTFTARAFLINTEGPVGVEAITSICVHLLLVP